MGQTAQVIVDLRYPNGQEVRHGIYSVTIYPVQLQNQYAALTYQQSSALSYSPELDRWVANVVLPSHLNAGVVAPIQESVSSYSGVYEAYVTGLSFDGLPTTTQPSAQQSFLIQPYLYVANQTLPTNMQTWQLALSGVTIDKTLEIRDSVLLNSNIVQSSNLTLTNCKIEGTLIVNNANLTLKGVTGGNIAATNSSLNLQNSDLTSLVLANSSLTVSSSTFGTNFSCASHNSDPFTSQGRHLQWRPKHNCGHFRQ